MENDDHMSSWFRSEYDLSREVDGKTGDDLRLAMYKKGIGYLQHVIENKNSKKKDLIEVVKMIEYSQGWIDKTDGPKVKKLNFERMVEDGDLEKFTERFEDITDWSKTSEDRKTERLSELMTEMERTFLIPAMNHEEYNQKNPEVIALYRKIANARATI